MNSDDWLRKMLLCLVIVVVGIAFFGYRLNTSFGDKEFESAALLLVSILAIIFFIMSLIFAISKSGGSGDNSGGGIWGLIAIISGIAGIITIFQTLKSCGS